MNKFFLTTILTTVTTSSVLGLPAGAKTKDKLPKVKLEAIPSQLTLSELQENIFFHEPLCRASSVGIATNFGAQGTGVIISKEGVILTAAHVVDNVGAEFTAYLSNGQSVKAVALLINHQTDSAVAKIIDPMPEGGFAYRPIRKSADLVKGDWCTVIANGGGIQPNRPAPLRIGRILINTKTKAQNVLVSDCTVTSGDSGGPLFDTDGNVCGINSAVGAGSALDNKHISSETFIQQWGEYLVEGKSLPTAEEAKKKELARAKAAGESTSAIPSHVLPALKAALKKQFPDLPDEGVDAMLEHATYASGRLTINSTPELIAKFKKLNLDPEKYGVKNKDSKSKANDNKAKPKAAKPAESKKEAEGKQKQPKAKLSLEEELRKKFGNIPEPAIAFLKERALASKGGNIKLTKEDMVVLSEMGVDLEDLRQSNLIVARFGKMSEEAMQLIKSKFLKNGEGKYELKVTPKDVATLSKMGVNIMGAKDKKLSDKAMLENLFRQQFGKDIPQKGLDILHSAAHLDKKTGQLRLNLDASKLKKLIDLGVKVNTGDNKKLDPFGSNHGDSALSIAKLFPATSTPIHLMQDGKRVGLATAITSDGQLLSKSSSLTAEDKITVLVSGKAVPAKVVSRDEIADLVLIKAALPKGESLNVAEWSDTLRRGKLIVSGTEAESKLGVVSVDKRIVPEKTMGVGNGNKAILGVVSDITKDVDGSHIEQVQPGTPAAKGGIKAGDVITSVGGQKVSSQEELRAQVGKYQGGDRVKFIIKRGDKTMELMIELLSAEQSDMFSSDATNNAAQDLSALAGELSARRTTFPEAFSHDALIWNDDCGGPVYTIDGKLLGINIARYSRITSYALTQKSVEEALERMKK